MVFTSFRGVVYIWLIGLPFLVFIVFMRREYRYDLMMVDSNKFDSLNQAVSQILYLTRCLNYYSILKRYSLLYLLILQNN